MLNIPGRRVRCCDGVTRRQVLRVGAFGALFSLADWLRAGEMRRRAAVLVYLPGGLSHLDSFDPKPAAPAEVRGEFRAIPTNVPGIALCEHLPRLAAMCDEVAILRAVVSPEVEHRDAVVMTGYPAASARTGSRPSFGSVVSKARGMAGGMPPFVSLRGRTEGCEPGFLGVAHRAFAPGGDDTAGLTLPPGVTPDRLSDRRALLAALDAARRDLDAAGPSAGLGEFRRQAFDIVTSGRVRAALDLSREPGEVLERYDGAETFLKTRRLIEAGVGCVTLSVGEWDTHKDNFRALKEQLPALDRGLSAFLTDLHERGLSDDVVTVVWGEFGRTPVINRDAGRDHWPAVMSTLVAGGGLRMGQAIGSTTSRGDQPNGRHYRVSQVLATLYRAIGIDPDQPVPDRNGRPVYLLEDREPVRELL